MRVLHFLIGCLLLGYLSAGAQNHQRLVVTGGALVPYRHYEPGERTSRLSSMEELHLYAEQWRKELGGDNLFLVDIPVNEPDILLQVFERLANPDIRGQLLSKSGYCEGAAQDSVLARFGLTREGLRDSLQNKSAREWVILDRYEVGGHVAISSVKKIAVTPGSGYTRWTEGDEILRFTDDRILNLDTPITTRDCFFGPSAFAALFHRFHLDASGARVSFFAPPREDFSFDKGPLSIQDVLRLFTFDNQLVSVNVTGEQLLEFMEMIFGMRFFTIKGPDSDLVRTRVPYYLYDDVSGIRFRVDLTRPSGKRITVYEMQDGSKFDPKGSYTLVMNSFRARHFTEKEIPVRTVHANYKLALAEWLWAHRDLQPRQSDNWSLGPERWVEEIAQRERGLLFP